MRHVDIPGDGDMEGLHFIPRIITILNISFNNHYHPQQTHHSIDMLHNNSDRSFINCASWIRSDRRFVFTSSKST